MKHDDDAGRTSDTNKTVRLDVDDIDVAPDFPDFPDHDEFVKTQEMDSLHRSQTNPSQTSLETTQRYDVPDDLLAMAMRSQEMEVLKEPEWREFVAIVDPRGRIVLPSRVQQEMRGKKIRVKYIVEGK